MKKRAALEGLDREGAKKAEQGWEKVRDSATPGPEPWAKGRI
jgi:hypothetical protein